MIRGRAARLSVDPKRGEIWWVGLDPTLGSEIAKARPCVVITSDDVNAWRRTVVVMPLSNSSKGKPPLKIAIPSQGKTSAAVTDQIRAVTKERLARKIGAVSTAELAAIEDALREVLEI
jgi:mRNA interferase MazF